MSKILVMLGLVVSAGLPFTARAAGWEGGEPSAYATTLFVDVAAGAGGDGSEAKPYGNFSAGVRRVNEELKAGRSVKLLVRPGVYRESLPTVGEWMDFKDNSRNADLKSQDAWLRVDRWGDSGDVVISGSDDWSDGSGPGGGWQPVAGRPGLFSRAWTNNWGLWGGSKGSANVTGTAGQRREMVFVDLGDRKDVQRLSPVVLEKFSHVKPSDTGNAGSWWGPGAWTYEGYAGLDVLSPGSFGVVEMSDSPEDDPTPEKDWTKHQDGAVVMKGSDGKPRHVPFKEIYRGATNKAPAGEVNRIFVRLPEGADIRTSRIYVSTRQRAVRIQCKRNVVLANFTVEHFNPPMFSAAISLGRGSHDWWLSSGNTLCERLVIRQNNANGMDVSGMMGATWRDCRFAENGATGLNPAYCQDLKLERCVFTGSGWRAHALGRSYTFIPGALKTWNVAGLDLNGCVFADNHYKGFYSDNALQDAVFRQCEFRGNIVGSMHEIARGPIRYEQCRFDDNKQGLAVIQAAGVSAADCDFVNNLAAVVPEAKPRTTCTMKPRYAWGDSLLMNEESPVNLDKFEMTGCRLSSSVRGARLIVQGSRYSDAKFYWDKMTTNAKYRDNRYFLADHPFAFEGQRGFVDFSGWTAATKETGAKWDASLASPLRTAFPQYPAGYEWKRSADWTRVGGGESDIGRIVRDSQGGSPWAMRIIPAAVARDATGLAGAKPWYTLPADHMSFRSGAKCGYLAHSIDHGWPWADASEVGATAWTADYVYGTPLVEWANPSGKPIRIQVAGTLRLKWSEKSTPTAIHLAIVRSSPDGTFAPLFSQAVPRPDSLRSETLVSTSTVTLGPSDCLLIAHFIASGSGYGCTAILEDDLVVRKAD